MSANQQQLVLISVNDLKILCTIWQDTGQFHYSLLTGMWQIFLWAYNNSKQHGWTDGWT